jgi:uncharacterized protein YceK
MKKIWILAILCLLLNGCESTEPTTEPIEEEPEVKQEEIIEEEPEQKEQHFTDIIDIDEFNYYMTTNLSDEEYYEYFESIKWIEGETLEIEFDAHVLIISPHEKYNTRCELLIASGDFNNGEFNGPYIKTRDIGYIDLHGIHEGSNVRIKAEIEKYDKDAGWLKIRIIDIESR